MTTRSRSLRTTNNIKLVKRYTEMGSVKAAGRKTSGVTATTGLRITGLGELRDPDRIAP